ncbi:gamma-sarcoglycan isoform X2 [Sinocyclocheilus rhinocerous]|uniref:gamma-sarcoglycan isoform X2 n=1 Tax=Sinocyclocheilus rhinocerous TaxID=307959 RepID=UPI0007B86C95|nr:PREDICTED: uncharacterized protein LOC107724972 isoform X2 [Sinocyclocheilus rhinocerous]XP_016389564.1 PREDICTED: uncharacterized protein LOC107724972 isoform X2 [Sinocyclocheilus rhinocerous]
MPVSRPVTTGPRDEPMPTDPNPPAMRAWLAGCIVHRAIPSGAPERKVRIDGRPVKALLDSGSSVSLARPDIAPMKDSKIVMPITCVHGDTRYVPARSVTNAADTGSWRMEVGVVKYLPVPLLLGCDWPGLDRLLSTTMQPARQRRPRRGGAKQVAPRRLVMLATDSEPEGESHASQLNVYSDLFQQVAAGGSFSRDQREDERLKNCWDQVRVINGKERLPPPHPTPHFIVENGLLYCVALRSGEEKRLCLKPRQEWFCPWPTRIQCRAPGSR